MKQLCQKRRGDFDSTESPIHPKTAWKCVPIERIFIQRRVDKINIGFALYRLHFRPSEMKINRMALGRNKHVLLRIREREQMTFAEHIMKCANEKQNDFLMNAPVTAF